MNILPPYARSRTFTLPITAVPTASSARAVLRLEDTDAPNRVGQASVTVVSAPAGFSLVCDKFRPLPDSGVPLDPTLDASWRLTIDTATDIGELPMQDFNFCPGVGYRAISGGTAGDVVIDVTWEALP